MTVEVVELPLPWKMNTGAPMTVLRSNGRDLVVSFWKAGFDGEQRIALRFSSCEQFLFGYPNDEALPGHPLYSLGLSYYGLFEVHGSGWAGRLRLQNQVPFPDTDLEHASALRHFIVTFHDETLEALAIGVEVALIEGKDRSTDGSNNEWTSLV